MWSVGDCPNASVLISIVGAVPDGARCLTKSWYYMFAFLLWKYQYKPNRFYCSSLRSMKLLLQIFSALYILLRISEINDKKNEEIHSKLYSADIILSG